MIQLHVSAVFSQLTIFINFTLSRPQIINVQHQVTKHSPKSVVVLLTTEHEIVNLAKSLKGKQAAGYDDIPEHIVKQCIQAIKKTLTHIFNTSFREGVFPKQWKLAKIKPLYKKGDRIFKITDLYQYLPVFAKLFEKLMFNRITSFLNDTESLTEVQNGFRKGKSIEIAIQTLMEPLREALDNRKHAIGIFIDLSKAYDTLDHEKLLEKLALYGIQGVTHSWFKCYLTNRSQYTEINQETHGNNLVSCHRSSPKRYSTRCTTRLSIGAVVISVIGK